MAAVFAPIDGGDPTVMSSAVDLVIWFAVVASIGALNGLVLYAVCALWARICERSGEDSLKS